MLLLDVCHRARFLNKLFESQVFALALARIERIAMIFHQAKDGPIGCLDLFAIDVLRTGYTKDAILPEAITTAVIEFVVDHVRDKLLRGLDRHPILGLRKQAAAEQCDHERCAWMHAMAPRDSCRTVTGPRRRSPARPPYTRLRRMRYPRPGFSDLGSCNDQVWSVGEFQLVPGIACEAAAITHFISLQLCGGLPIPTSFTVVR